jgi:acyl carrier protein
MNSGTERPVVDQVRQILAEAAGRPELTGIAPQTALFGPGIGLDSLAGTLLLRRVRDRFGVDVAAEDLNLDALATVATLTAFIEARIGEGGPGRPGQGPDSGPAETWSADG